MKVQKLSESFNATLPEVAKAIRIVLAVDPPYRSTTEDVPTSIFSTTIQPTKGLMKLLFLDTAAKVRLENQGEGCLVTIEITPSDGVAADIFGFYKKFMKNLMGSVCLQVERQSAISQ